MRVVKLKGVKRINGLHYAPDGRLLVVSGYKEKVAGVGVLLDPTGGMELVRLVLAGEQYAVAWDAAIIVAAESSRARLSWSCPSEPDESHTIPFLKNSERAHIRDIEFHGLAIDPTGKRLAISFTKTDTDDIPLAELIIIRTGAQQRGRVEFDSEMWQSKVLAFSPDGKRIATSRDTAPTVVVIDGKTLDADSSRPLTLAGTEVRQLLYSPSDKELAVVTESDVYSVPADSGTPRLTLTHPKQVNCVAFSPDGRQLVSACQDKLIRVWDVKTGELLRSYDWKVGAMTALAFAADGLTVAAGGTKGQVVVWDWE